MRRRFLLFVLAGLLLAGLLLVGCQPSPAQRVDRLSRSFPLLEQLRVEGYGNEDWCKYLTYRRGRFSDGLESQRCNLFREAPQPFDAQAQQDFEQVARSLSAAGNHIYRIRDIQYSPRGAIVGATFTMKAAPTYVYAPAYKALPADLSSEIEHIVINQDWYLIRMTDWN